MHTLKLNLVLVWKHRGQAYCLLRVRLVLCPIGFYLRYNTIGLFLFLNLQVYVNRQFMSTRTYHVH